MNLTSGKDQQRYQRQGSAGRKRVPIGSAGVPSVFIRFFRIDAGNASGIAQGDESHSLH